MRKLLLISTVLAAALGGTEAGLAAGAWTSPLAPDSPLGPSAEAIDMPPSPDGLYHSTRMAPGFLPPPTQAFPSASYDPRQPPAASPPTPSAPSAPPTGAGPVYTYTYSYATHGGGAPGAPPPGWGYRPAPGWGYPPPPPPVAWGYPPPPVAWGYPPPPAAWGYPPPVAGPARVAPPPGAPTVPPAQTGVVDAETGKPVPASPAR